jgi:hypothetical protein
LYVSSNDRALLMSRVLNRGRRLGESKLNPRNPDPFEAAANLYELLEPNDERITLVDVTPVNRTRNFDNFSLETPEFFDDLYLRLVNVDMPRSRPVYRVKTPSGSEYRVLTQARQNLRRRAGTGNRPHRPPDGFRSPPNRKGTGPHGTS